MHSTSSLSWPIISTPDIDQPDLPQVDVDTTRRPRAERERALVLGGGGSTGNAWMIGVIAGLLVAGVDLTVADLVIGTSAGATTAAQILSANPADLLAPALAASPARPSPTRPAGGSDGTRAAAESMERTRRIIEAASDAADMRRRMGEAACALATDDSWRARWHAVVSARLPSQKWPDRALLITVVDAGTGVPVVFDRSSGVELADAVAASCSSGAAYRIGNHHYIDGGYRRNENADLAAGSRRVVVLSPFGGRTRHPLAWGTHLAAQVDELHAGGSRIETIVPGSDADYMLGSGTMDPSLWPVAARAGHAQGTALAAHLAAFWG